MEMTGKRKQLFWEIECTLTVSLTLLYCRGVLDFDFEKLCSVSLSRINCYACLVCGKYFQVGSVLRTEDPTFFFIGSKDIYIMQKTMGAGGMAAWEKNLKRRREKIE